MFGMSPTTLLKVILKLKKKKKNDSGNKTSEQFERSHIKKSTAEILN